MNICFVLAIIATYKTVNDVRELKADDTPFEEVCLWDC